jgi:hypothetical protein
MVLAWRNRWLGDQPNSPTVCGAKHAVRTGRGANVQHSGVLEGTVRVESIPSSTGETTARKSQEGGFFFFFFFT